MARCVCVCVFNDRELVRLMFRVSESIRLTVTGVFLCLVVYVSLLVFLYIVLREDATPHLQVIGV